MFVPDFPELNIACPSSGFGHVYLSNAVVPKSLTPTLLSRNARLKSGTLVQTLGADESLDTFTSIL